MSCLNRTIWGVRKNWNERTKYIFFQKAKKAKTYSLVYLRIAYTNPLYFGCMKPGTSITGVPGCENWKYIKKVLTKRHSVTYIIDTVSFKFVLMGVIRNGIYRPHTFLVPGWNFWRQNVFPFRVGNTFSSSSFLEMGHNAIFPGGYHPLCCCGRIQHRRGPDLKFQ